jgi:hypothetical protein
LHPNVILFRNSQLWRLITSCEELKLRWCPKQNCSLSWDLFNDMQHETYTHIIQGDSCLLMVKSQIGTLTFDPSFGHNLWYKYSNVLCKPILDICVSRSSQWYKDFFNPMSFDPWNPFLNIWDSIGIPTPKVRVHLGVCGFIPSHSLTLFHTLGSANVTPRLHFWPAPFHARALIASPKLRSW